MSRPRDGRRGYDAADRARIRNSLSAGEPLQCPRCAAPLHRTAIEARPDIAYARRRLWLHCVACDRATTIDAVEPADG